MHTNPAKVYFIGYGNWTNGAKPSDSQATVNLMDAQFGPTRGIGGSSYFQDQPAYSDTVGYAAGNKVLLASSTNNYSRGKQLAASDIQNIVSGAITSRGVAERCEWSVLRGHCVGCGRDFAGFCTHYCGWHTSSTIGELTSGSRLWGIPTVAHLLAKCRRRARTAAAAPMLWPQS
jgi:hypothetical protein